MSFDRKIPIYSVSCKSMVAVLTPWKIRLLLNFQARIMLEILKKRTTKQYYFFYKKNHKNKKKLDETLSLGFIF